MRRKWVPSRRSWVPSRRSWVPSRRSWVIAGLAVLCVVLAAVVAWWPEDDTTVQVESADQHGICVRDLSSGDEQCFAYTPELPSEARYQTGECLTLRWVYRSDVPPHVKRVSCPG